jgi:transketolase
MRVEFANALIKNYTKTANQVFITGDLGFMALEGVRETFDTNFINGGIAEQNIVTMAAAMAHEGFIPWVYSISPFITLRPYEQIRNDVCQLLVMVAVMVMVLWEQLTITLKILVL